MSIFSQYSRISHHTTLDGSTFSVPTQEDFTLPSGASGSWTINDLALSEIGVDEFNQRAFIRIGGTISEFSFTGTSSGSSQTLADTLVLGNITGANDIILSDNDGTFTHALRSPSQSQIRFSDDGGLEWGEMYINSIGAFVQMGYGDMLLESDSSMNLTSYGDITVYTETNAAIQPDEILTLQSANSYVEIISGSSYKINVDNKIEFVLPSTDSYIFPNTTGQVGQHMEMSAANQMVWATSSSSGSETLAQTLALGNDVGGFVISGTSANDDFALSLTDANTSLLADGNTILSSDGTDMDITSDGALSVTTNSDDIEISAGTFIDIDASSQYVSVNDLRHETSTVSTTDATVTTIASVSLGGFGASASNVVEAYVTGVDDTGANAYGAKLFAVIKSDQPLTTPSIIGSVDLTEKTDFGAGPTSTIDISGTNVRVRVTGKLAVNITWYCKLIYTND